MVTTKEILKELRTATFENQIFLVPTRVSNGTGQKLFHCPGTKGQRDNVKIFLQDRPGQDFDIVPQDGVGRNFDILTPDGPGRNFDSLSRYIPGQPRDKKKKRVINYNFRKIFHGKFFYFFLTFFVPGSPGTPGIFAAALVPGQSDSRTRKLFCPGKKGQWDVLDVLDVPFWIVQGCPDRSILHTY